MPLRKTRRRLISAAAAVPLLIAIACQLAPYRVRPQAHQVPQANLNPCPQEKGKVNITFWTWERPPSVIQHIVNEFNASHPDIHVTVDQVTPGFSGGYENAFNALRAGKAPDVDMIEYYELPNFRFVNGLYNVAGCPAMDNVAVRSSRPGSTTKMLSESLAPSMPSRRTSSPLGCSTARTFSPSTTCRCRRPGRSTSRTPWRSRPTPMGP